jgi:hypothetical protein
MQGPFRTPEALAQALLRGPITASRIRRLLWHARKGTEAAFQQTLAAIPDPAVRAQVEAAAVPVSFRG